MMHKRQPGLHRRLELESVRISRQHERLNQMYADLQLELSRGRTYGAIVHFDRMRVALEAHFEVEDQIYFPAVHGLRPDREQTLRELESEHALFKEDLARIGALFEAHDSEEANLHLRRLVEALVDHESREETLLSAPERASNPDRTDASCVRQDGGSHEASRR